MVSCGVVNVYILQVDKLEVVNKKWVRLKMTPGSQVESVCIVTLSIYLYHQNRLFACAIRLIISYFVVAIFISVDCALFCRTFVVDSFCHLKYMLIVDGSTKMGQI